MKLNSRLAQAILLGCTLTSFGTPAYAEMTEAGKKATIAAGQIMFEQRCRSCHAEDPAAQSYGPSLLGIIGRMAGTLEGFEYSDAMKKSGIVWNPASLRAWIADNDGFMPGTRMRHVGIKDTAEQDFLIAYIGTLK
ncbi:MAG: c-type cytochrome [Pseudomonadota bacterium]